MSVHSSNLFSKTYDVSKETKLPQLRFFPIPQVQENYLFNDYYNKNNPLFVKK